MGREPANGRGDGERSVLLVEDDPDTRQALAELLEDAGFRCILAAHGRAAIEALSHETPSLLLIDLLMPVMNGVELIARLRGDARWEHLPIVVMTADGDRIIGVDLSGLDVDVLGKPVDIAELARVLAHNSGVVANLSEGT